MAHTDRRWTASVGAVIMAVALAVVAAGQGRAQAQDSPRVIVADDFENPDASDLPEHSSRPDESEIGLVDGEYFIRGLRRGVVNYVALRPHVTDTTFSIDARIVGEPRTKSLVIGCRVVPAGGGTNGYFLSVTPGSGLVSLFRRDAGKRTRLTEDQVVSALRTEQGNIRMELTCSGTGLRGSVNGGTVIEAADDRYRDGHNILGLGSGDADEAEARFDNLFLTEAPPAAAPPAVGQPEPASAGDTVLVDETLAVPAPRVLGPFSSPANGVTAGYLDGEYFIRREAGPQWIGGFAPELSRAFSFADGTIAIDVRIEGEADGRAAALYCRMGPGLYRFAVEPESGFVLLDRLDPSGRFTALRSGTAPEAIGSTVRMELTCVGSTLTGRANGVAIAVAEDATYQEGRPGIGISSRHANAAIEVRFRNLRITRAAMPAAAPTTAAPAPPAQPPPPPAAQSACPVSTDPTYGYTRENPIKVGGDAVGGPRRAAAYLNTLRGPNGESLTFRRRGSLPGMGTILDNYEISGLANTVTLYVDQYAWTEPMAPLGFTCATPFPLSPP